MRTEDRARRRALANMLKLHGDDIAVRVTDVFLERHPDWIERYGDGARLRGIEDARYHVDFLAGAIQSGDEQAFANYARWTARVLAARGIRPHFLIENLRQVGGELTVVLGAAAEAEGRRYIEVACAAVEDQNNGNDGDENDNGLDSDLRLYIEAVLGGHRTAALNIALEQLRRGLTVPDVYTRLLQAAQYEVGRLWERNEITVSAEHMATAVTQFVVAQLYSRMDISAPTLGKALVTGVKGELHQLGANMVADVLEADGWDVRFLGTQLPHRDIMDAIELHEPQLIGISATMLFNLPGVADLVEQIRKGAGDGPRIIVGGGAFHQQGAVWRDIGADGLGRDLRDTVSLARSLGCSSSYRT